MISRIVCSKRNLSVLHRSLQRQQHGAAALHLLLAQLCDFAVESSSRLKFVWVSLVGAFCIKAHFGGHYYYCKSSVLFLGIFFAVA
jgi:hypothetical protein